MDHPDAFLMESQAKQFHSTGHREEKGRVQLKASWCTIQLFCCGSTPFCRDGVSYRLQRSPTLCGRLLV